MIEVCIELTNLLTEYVYSNPTLATVAQDIAENTFKCQNNELSNEELLDLLQTAKSQINGVGSETDAATINFAIDGLISKISN